MITFIDTGSIFNSKCQTLVNPINCVGLMGAGLAKMFSDKYPAMNRDYRQRCNNGEVVIGMPYVYQTADKTVLNFPTKNDWRKASKIEYISDGLDYFVSNYKDMGITSIAFPALGAGLGGLDWETVKQVMLEKLSNLDIEIEIYSPK